MPRQFIGHFLGKGDGCVVRSNIGHLCVDPPSSSTALKQYVDGAGYGDDVVHTVSVLFTLGVPFKIETNGVKFVLPNMPVCESSANVRKSLSTDTMS